MTEAFLKKPDGVYQVLVKQLEQAEEMKRSALRYSAHLGALLREACDILEKLETDFIVSEPLQCWWEKEKRKREAKACYLLSNQNSNLPDQRSATGSGVGHSDRIHDSKPVVVSTIDNIPETGKDS